VRVENSAIRRGLVLLVLVTCTMLALWWLVDRAKEDSPIVTPTASLTASP
jgi:hypothetical protein